MREQNLPSQIFPEVLTQEIVDRIFVDEAPHRPDLMFLEREEIEAIVRLAILQLEKWALFDEEKLKNLEIEIYVPVPGGEEDGREERS